MHRRSLPLVSSVPAIVLGLVAAGLLGAPAAAADPAPHADPPLQQAEAGEVLVEVPPTVGGTWGQYASVPEAASPSTSSRRAAPRVSAEDGSVTALGDTGPTDARLDVVVMGDGYTAAEQGDFEEDARRSLGELLDVEPYASYQGLANFWMVHAESTDSGVSRDADSNPGTVLDKDTALGSYFWCNNTERLLCVDTAAVNDYAQLAPAADLVVVVANSPRYGGAGYHHGYGGDLDPEYEFSGISTLSSDHSLSYLVAAHEIGHSLGGLADEYYYCSEPGYEAYCTWYGFVDGDLYWGEVPESNATIYGPGAGFGPGYLIENQYKWFRWLGEQDPSGGTVGMYDGGRYYASGIYRPTQDSIMKSLANTSFNLPGTEAMIAGFYRYAAALSSEVPSGSTVSRTDQLSVDVADLGGLARLGEVRWFVDGREAKQARGETTVVPKKLGVPASGSHTLVARISDRTASLRDPQILDTARSELSWTVVR